VRAARAISVTSLLLLALLVGAAAASARDYQGGDRGSDYTCTGGPIAPGTYRSIRITGICTMPAGTIVVRSDLFVAPGALLDAVTPGDPSASPVVPASVYVGGNVFVGNGGVLVLGCSPNIACSSGVTYDRIGGNLTALGALGVVVHSANIGGNVTMLGGGGGAAGGAESGGCYTAPIPAPWSEDAALSSPTTGSPQYADFEDNSIGGNLTVVGVQTCWLGAFRNLVGGDARFIGDSTSDPNGMGVVNNLVAGRMACASNLPAVQFGSSGAAPNIVGGFASGECGFGVLVPNPAPAAGSGIDEHISVPSWRLQTYRGTHTATNVSTQSCGTTESGHQLLGLTGTAVLAGGGLTGSPEEQELITVHRSRAESFTVEDLCSSCSFDGQTGPVIIAAKGTTSASGLTRGTFLTISGGSFFAGGLDTLAGYGKFSSAGEPAGTVRLIEHLGIT